MIAAIPPRWHMGPAPLRALGQTERAKEWMRQAILIDPENIVMQYNLACTAVLNLDEIDTGLEYLTAFLAKATPYQVHLAEHDPDLRKLHDNPRFLELIAAAKVRLEDSKQASPAEAATPRRS